MIKHFHFLIGLLLSSMAFGQGTGGAPLGLDSIKNSVVYSDTSGPDKVFYKVEREATFPGGPEGWRDYLVRNLKSNVAVKEGLPAGKYAVKVTFIVDKEGKVGRITIDEPGVCKKCAAEAIRILEKSPRWQPAFQSGKNVMYMASQKFVFVVE